MDKKKMLNKLISDLNNKTDEELIKDYQDAGINVVSYNPGSIGEVKDNEIILQELIKKIAWKLSFLEEDIAAERYSKENNIKTIEDIRDNVNKIIKMIYSE